MKRAPVHGLLVLVAVWLSMAAPAEAYIGPGAGISVIGTVIAFLAAVVFAIVGFVWYPVKRLRASMRAKREGGQRQATPAS